MGISEWLKKFFRKDRRIALAAVSQKKLILQMDVTRADGSREKYIKDEKGFRRVI